MEELNNLTRGRIRQTQMSALYEGFHPRKEEEEEEEEGVEPKESRSKGTVAAGGSGGGVGVFTPPDPGRGEDTKEEDGGGKSLSNVAKIKARRFATITTMQSLVR